LSSPAFDHEGVIPAKFSCDDQDIAPELTWEGAPEGTASFVLIVDDPDAPVGTWVHWVVYNIPAGVKGLKEAASSQPALPDGAQQGKNGWRRTDYGGPCPPRGEHRYFFKLYALDMTLDLDPGAAGKANVEAAMEGHVLAEATLMGRYTRQ
jgi:Raf kinase inhibitor-like YbhB/YbcL family protein